MNEENATRKSLRVDLETTLTKCFFKQYNYKDTEVFLKCRWKKEGHLSPQDFPDTHHNPATG